MDRTTIWLVSQGPSDNWPRPVIETKGYATSVSDLFHVVGLHQTGHDSWNSCYTDITTCKGLSTVIEGQVSGWQDIEAAETALQILFWHDRVDVIVPGFLHKFDGYAGYMRCEEDRSALCYDLFRPVQPQDAIYAVEEATSSDGIITVSNLADSSIIGKSVNDISASYLKQTPIQAMAISSIPMYMGVPAYFSNPQLVKRHDNKGHFGRFYDVTRDQWDSAGHALPVFEMNVHLPPLITIVLDRATNREDIPRVISELRDELNPVRKELLGLNEFYSDVMKGSYNQVEIEDRCRYVSESFEAAFLASRHKDGFFLLPLLKLYQGIKNPLDTIINKLNPNYNIENPHLIADRTLTGKMFSKLLITDSMHSILSHFFTDTEINNLSSSKPE